MVLGKAVFYLRKGDYKDLGCWIEGSGLQVQGCRVQRTQEFRAWRFSHAE